MPARPGGAPGTLDRTQRDRTDAPKLREIVHEDLLDLAAIEPELSGFDGLTRPLWPVLYRAFPRFVTTTEQVGRAMLTVAKEGAAKPILETQDINAL